MKKISGQTVQKEDLKVIGKDISERFKQLCNFKNISLNEISSLTKIPYKNLKEIESGTKMISLKEAKIIASILDVSPQYLISGN